MRLPLPAAATIMLRSFAIIGTIAACKPIPASSQIADPPPAGTPATTSSSVTCAGLTAQQASTVLHKTVTLGVDTSDGDGRSNCTYTIAGGGTVRVYVVVGTDGKQQYDALKDGVTTPTAVSGIGDEAFDSDQALGARQGDHFVSVV